MSNCECMLCLAPVAQMDCFHQCMSEAVREIYRACGIKQPTGMTSPLSRKSMQLLAFAGLQLWCILRLFMTVQNPSRDNILKRKTMIRGQFSWVHPRKLSTSLLILEHSPNLNQTLTITFPKITGE